MAENSDLDDDEFVATLTALGAATNVASSTDDPTLQELAEDVQGAAADKLRGQ